MPADLVEFGATGEQLVALSELTDDLIGRLPTSSHKTASCPHHEATDPHNPRTTTQGSPQYSLAIDNAIRAMDAWERLRQLEQNVGLLGDDLQGVDSALREQIAGALRPSLQRLGQMTDRGLIDGGSARTSAEPLPELRPVDGEGPLDRN